jgi:(R,R)-butanediol dehydrogenase/meso-butanediol dehydrogenase/diacetyl reductase
MTHKIRGAKLRAASFKAFGAPLELICVADPEPGEGEVVLKVGRCGICGTDLHMTEAGGYGQLGSILGHEYSGEIVALGKGVSRLKIGDHVASMPLKGCGACAPCLTGEPAWCVHGITFLSGGYAQYVRAAERECLLLPAGLSEADGALVEPLAVALHGMRSVAGISGAKVTVIGAGPIGLSAIYWARRFGARHIEVVEMNPARVDMAMKMGADSSRSPAAEKGSKPKGSDMPDFVFECVGKPGLLAASVAAVRPRGTIVSLGFCMAPEPFTAWNAGVRELTIKFPVLYTLEDYQIALESLAKGHVEPRAMITEVVSLDNLPAVFESLRKPSQQCKVMIDPWATYTKGH